ncbi:unnamed protein product [Echinostoma caproni]|uniref:HCO3_cotransp domain-containing protein n=1 Tax=Echinostoma caproni TaxID=27848 RepID=A0A183AAG6_9TREM|nr:unnamed protein product [Echinostoma caproni]
MDVSTSCNQRKLIFIRKGTKSEIEIGRTFATILSDPEFRTSLMYAAGEDEVKSLLWARAQELSVEQAHYRRRSSNLAQAIQLALATEASSSIFSGIYGDLRRRIPHYWSDIKEDVTQMIIAQTLGGLSFGFLGGQPLIVLLSTAPLALYIKTKITFPVPLLSSSATLMVFMIGTDASWSERCDVEGTMKAS